MDNNEYGFNNMNGENNNAVENADVSSENVAQSAVETRTASGEQVYGSTQKLPRSALTFRCYSDVR